MLCVRTGVRARMIDRLCVVRVTVFVFVCVCCATDVSISPGMASEPARLGDIASRPLPFLCVCVYGALMWRRARETYVERGSRSFI